MTEAEEQKDAKIVVPIANDDDEVPPFSYFAVKYGGLMLILVGVSVGVVLALRFWR